MIATPAGVVGTVTLAGASAAGIAAAKSVSGSPITDIIILIAAVVTALSVIAKLLHLPEIRRGIRDFLRSYFGEPARPGHDAIPGIPEQMADTKTDLTQLSGDLQTISGRDSQVVVTLEQIVASARALAEALARVEDRANINDQRVTAHAARNAETARVLQAAVEKTASDLERKLDARNADLDRRLEGMSEDRAQNEAMRAVITELGLTTPLPHPPTSHRDQPPDSAEPT